MIRIKMKKIFKIAGIKKLFVFILIFSWVFSGWPQIFNFPPVVREARAVIAYVSSDIAADSGTSVTSLAVTFTSNVTANNLIVVAVLWFSDTITAVNVPTDTRSTSYTRALGTTTYVDVSAIDMHSKIFYGFPDASGANTVTVTWASAIEQPSIIVSEYSGIATAGALDQALAGTGNDGTGDSGNVTTTQADELLIGFVTEWQWLAHTPDINYNEREDGAQGVAFEDRIVSATGAYNATYTYTQSRWIMSIVTFRASGPPAVRKTPHKVRGKVAIRGKVKFR
jgi:hypothetical protein